MCSWLAPMGQLEYSSRWSSSDFAIDTREGPIGVRPSVLAFPVRSIKEAGRPILTEDHRAAVLAGLGCVDYVTIFDRLDPIDLLLTLRPDVLVKGADYSEDGVVGAAEVKAYGGRIRRIEVVYAISTSDIIRRVLECFGVK